LTIHSRSARIPKGRPQRTVRSVPKQWACGVAGSAPRPCRGDRRFELFFKVGLWRSWERASMAWKRSSVRSRPGPPYLRRFPETALSAPRPCRGGRRFDPDQVHHIYTMPAVYVLQSESSKRFYIGCAEQPEVRLAEHLRGQTISTRGRGPWTLVYQERFDNLAQARQRKRQLKSWKSHRSVQELIDKLP
jgi:putative endonuclease